MTNKPSLADDLRKEIEATREVGQVLTAVLVRALAVVEEIERMPNPRMIYEYRDVHNEVTADPDLAEWATRLRELCR